MTHGSAHGLLADQASAGEAAWRTRVALGLLVLDLVAAGIGAGIRVMPGTQGAAATGWSFVVVGALVAAGFNVVVVAVDRRPNVGLPAPLGWRWPLVGLALLGVVLMLLVPLLILLSLVPDGAEGHTVPLLLVALAALAGFAIDTVLVARAAIGLFVRRRIRT